MKTKIKRKISEKEILQKKYPKVPFEKLPERHSYGLETIEYKKDEIERFHIVFWHRLLKEIYQEPSETDQQIIDKKSNQVLTRGVVSLRNKDNDKDLEIEPLSDELFNGLKSGKLTLGLGEEWRYFIGLESGAVLELGSRDSSTYFSISALKDEPLIRENGKREEEKFINLILAYADRRKDLFNPKAEFKKGSKIQLYSVRNAYLSNYISAEAMLNHAETEEPKIARELIRYDFRDLKVRFDPEKIEYTDHLFQMRGMFYLSAIMYFIMALEGFVNLIFHCFLKNEHRNKSFKIEQRIDLEVKIRLLTSLCDGFCEEKDILSDIYNDFSKLRKLRNSFFHSKIEDSVDNMSVMEDGFLYSVDFDRFVRGFPPNSKISLTEKEVETVKNTVDLVVNNIFSSMDTESQKFVENTFMREYSIDIMVNPNGELRVVSSTAKSTKYS